MEVLGQVQHHPAGEGGGGLFIVRTLVERYSGTVQVEDRAGGRPEEGAAFRFTLKKAGARQR